jgi:hypothetical protein
VSIATPVTQCRSCGRADLHSVLSLGSTPIANELTDSAEAAKALDCYPLGIVFCPECSLVQLGHELPAEAIFDDDYPYFSSFSDALCRHSDEHVTEMIRSRGLDATNLVVELASNDGYLLQYAQAAGVPVLGIDPARGPAEAAVAKGIPTINDFFTPELARKVRADGKVADLIIANNVMAHVPDLNGFVEGMSILLSDDGVITVENPYVRTLIDHREFDTIYHEHFCYFSCTAVDNLMQRHGLYLNDVVYFPDLHGGTCRWYISRSPQRSAVAERYLAEEQEVGLTTTAYYEQFAAAAASNREELRALCAKLKSEGKTVAAYGAAAKGATLLNYGGLTDADLEFVTDRNTHKQGRYMPGAGLLIRPVEALVEEQPDYVLLLAWNFAKEIVSQQQDYIAHGGKFIVPVPRPQVL